MYRGSRKHVLDWAETPRFLPELLALARPLDCTVVPESRWQPLGYRQPDEARLERFGPRALPEMADWPSLTSWWLHHARGANTPNWDIALNCRIEGQMGLLLVEAKANLPELSESAKPQDAAASPQSRENHEHIRQAIGTACSALQPQVPGLSISVEKHYQLSNRIAFAWKLASMGIPTVLIYLGFTGDTGIGDVGRWFDSDDDWQSAFHAHLRKLCPSGLCDRPIETAASQFWVLVRSRPVLQVSERLA